ncbi:MAG: sigma-70 family RNA polymerase sigma factor [Candidatus Krumholzibacteriia bacterium]
MDERHDPDAELVARALAAPADLRPFEDLVRRHEGKVLANCRHLTGSADDAQDLAQEVFVKAFFALKRFRGESRFGTWIQRIKVNHCLNFLRKRKNRHQVDIDDPIHEAQEALQVAPAAERRLASDDRRQLIAAALDRVPETLRVPLVMCDLDEMPYQEIADSLGLGLSAAKMRIKRGREAFRTAYEELTR